MSAVAEHTVAAPANEKVYVSRRSELKLFLQRDMPLRSQATGEVVDTRQGKRLQFRDGRLVIPLGSKTMRGERGELLDVAEVLDLLEGNEDEGIPPHMLLGNREEGFWELPKVAPPLGELEAERVVELAIAGDTDELEAMLDAEREGWQRTEMLELVEGALSKVRAAQAG